MGRRQRLRTISSAARKGIAARTANIARKEIGDDSRMGATGTLSTAAREAGEPGSPIGSGWESGMVSINACLIAVDGDNRSPENPAGKFTIMAIPNARCQQRNQISENTKSMKIIVCFA